MAPFKIVWRKWRCWGTFPLLKWLLVRITQLIINWELLYFYQVALPNQRQQSISEIEIQFKFICPGGGKELEETGKFFSGKAEKNVPDRCDCLIGKHENQMVYYAWVNYNSIYSRELMRFPLAQDQAYIYRVYTRPDYRGKGIAVAGYYFLFQHLAAREYSRCLVGVNFENEPSIRSIKKSGFVKLGHLLALRWGIKKWILHENISGK